MLTLHRLTTRLLVMVPIAALFVACEHNLVAPVGPLASIQVTPDPTTMGINVAQTFVAVGHDAAGNVVPITPTWSVVAGGGAIVSGTGVFTAGAAAATFVNTVKATSGGLSGFATVTVTNGALATITVTPNPFTLATNITQQFTATGRDASGNIVAIVPTWSVVAGGGAIGLASGLFTAQAAAGGPFANTVKATSGLISGTATVTVIGGPGALASITVTPNPATLAPGDVQVFIATGFDNTGAAVAILPAPTWSVVAAVGGGAINAGTGSYTAGAVAGTFTNSVKAVSGTVSGFATVIIPSVVPPLVPLGNAAPYGILAGTAVTCITGGFIFADVGVSPGNTLTGFGPCVQTGTQHLGDAVALAAQGSLTTAYNTLAGLPCPPANAIVADLGGTTKAAGVYCTASGIGVTGTLTLDGGGNPNAQFVFQAGTSLITAGSVVLINGAQAKNVYWQVGSSATLGTASQWQGNILTLTSVTLIDNANLHGRALARNGAVTLGTNNTITLP